MDRRLGFELALAACVAGCGGANADGGVASAASVDAGAPQGGWALTVYYTAVEAFHAGPAVDVVGCADIRCTTSQAALGAYPEGFVATVEAEGTGRITEGAQIGRFLNWAADTGYWLDDAPRDARGGALEPMVSAAADPALAFGTRFDVLDCGVDDENGSPPDEATCAALRSASWVVRDRFTSPAVGRHVDLYVGEEPAAGFESTAAFISDRDATLRFP